MTRLFDGNVLVALALPDHVHHHRVHRWLATIRRDTFATCPATEGTLLRLHMQFARDKSAEAAWAYLKALHAQPGHEFWPDGFSHLEIEPTRLTGHRQVTDSWLAALALRNRGQLATLDDALAALWPDAVMLVPV